MRDKADFYVFESGDNRKARVYQGLLGRERDTVAIGVDDQHPAFDAPANLESFLRMLERDIRIMIRPHHSVDISGYLDEECRVCEFLDGALNDLPDLDIANLHELLFEDRRLERQLEGTVECMVTCYACSVNGRDPPRAGRRG